MPKNLEEKSVFRFRPPKNKLQILNLHPEKTSNNKKITFF